MPPKKKTKDKSPVKDKKTASKVDSWKKILEIAALNSSAWTCQVNSFVQSSDNNGEHLNEFAKNAANGSRTDVKCLTMSEILETVKKIGNNGETTTENTVYLEAFDHLKNNNSIPPNILALVVKSQLLGIKDLDLKMKKEKEEFSEKLVKVENAMMAPRFVKSQPYKESEKKFGTELRIRGEEWRDKEFIKDAPADGPSIYVALVGFNDVSLISEFIRIGIPIKSIVMVNYEEEDKEEEEDSDDHHDFHDVETEKFWSDVENIKGDDVFKDTCFVEVNLCENEDAYDKMTFLMYDIQDLIRQHKNYLNHMRVIDLKDINQSNNKYLFRKYKNKIGAMKMGYSIETILDCMLFAVLDDNESVGQLTDLSVKVEIESENDRIIKTIRDKFKPKIIKPYQLENYNSNEEILDTFTPEPLILKKIETSKNEFYSFLDRTPSATPLTFLKEAEKQNYWESRLPTPISLRDFFEFTIIDDYDWIKSEDKKYKEKCKSVSIMSKSELNPGAAIDDDLILLDSIKYQLALIEFKNKLLPPLKIEKSPPEREPAIKTDSKKSKSPKGKKKEKKILAKAEPEMTLKPKPGISVHSIGYNIPHSLVQFSGWKSSTQLADGSIVNVESNFNTINKQRSLRLNLIINGHRIYFDRSNIRISTKNGIEMSYNHNNFSASWPNGLIIETIEDFPYYIQQNFGDFQKKFTKTGEVIHFFQTEFVDTLKLGHSIADLITSKTVKKATDYQKGTITITKDSFKTIFTSDGCQSATFPDRTCLTSRYLIEDKLVEGFVRVDMIYKAEHPNFCRVSRNTSNDIITLDMPDVSIDMGHNQYKVTFDEFTKLVIEGDKLVAYSKCNIFNIYTKDALVYCNETTNGERIFTVNYDGTIEGLNVFKSHVAVAEYERNPTTWKMPITACDELEKTDKGSRFKWKDIFTDRKNAAVAIPDTLESFKNKMRIIGIEKLQAETHRKLLRSGYIPPYFKNMEGSIWLWLTEIVHKAVPE